VIDVSNVTFYYPGDREPALEDVSIGVQPGETIGIVGPNGSGKSTAGRLMKAMLVPSSGKVTVDGLDTRTRGMEVRRLVGLLFQNPNSQIVNAVIADEVAFGPENLGLPPKEIRQRVRDVLRVVGLEGREDAESHSLSMADKQRVALASVLAMQPRYLILDEPTAWLEPAARWTLLDRVLAWKESSGAGLVLVTHRMDEAQICDRLYGLLDGTLQASGTAGDVLQDEVVRARLALELPATYALATELQAAGLPVRPGDPIQRLADTLWQS
jgi:energy-coupling factor transport system ATP-binding protein